MDSKANPDVIQANADVTRANADVIQANADVTKANADVTQANSDVNRNAFLRPGERLDDLQRGRVLDPDHPEEPARSLRIIQDPARFCFGMDAVLLSAYVQMKKARRGLDLGTGNGIIPLLLSDRTDCAHLTGLEIQPASADLAARSVSFNHLEDRISILQGDIREADRIFAAASFDFITCNPPYRAAGSGRINGWVTDNAAGSGRINGPAEPGAGTDSGKNRIKGIKISSATLSADHPDVQKGLGEQNASAAADPTNGLDPRAIARHELLCSFDDVAEAAARLLRPGGHFYLVHRPLRLPELITKLCARGLEPKRMRLVYPHIDQAPNMVLLDCVRGGAPELRVEPPLIVYEKDGSYTPELMQIYYG